MLLSLYNTKLVKFFVCSSGRFCGFAPPPLLTIPSNTVVIRFLSNGANQQQGFRGYWTTDASLIPTLPPPTPNPWDDITISECWPCPTAALSLMCDHVTVCGEVCEDWLKKNLLILHSRYTDTGYLCTSAYVLLFYYAGVCKIYCPVYRGQPCK